MLGRIQERPLVKALLANSAWVLADRLLRLPISLVVAAFVARWLGPSDFGIFSFAISVVALFQAFGLLGLGDVAARDFSRHEIPPASLVGALFTVRMAGACLGFVLCLVYAFFQESQLRLAVLIAGLTILAVPFEVGESWFQTRLKQKISVMIRFSIFLVGSLARVVLCWMGGDLILLIGIWAIEQILIEVLLLGRFLWSFPGPLLSEIRLATCWRLIRSAMPMTIFALLGTFVVKYDSIFVASHFRGEPLGLYNLSVRIMEIVYVIPFAVMGSALPVISRNPGPEARARIQELGSALTCAGGLITVAIFASASLIIPLAFGERYQDSARILCIHSLAIPFIFSGSVRNAIWISRGQEWALAGASLSLAALLPVVLGALGAPSLEQVAWFFVLGMITFNVGTSVVDREVLGIQLHGMNPINMFNSMRRFGIKRL